MKAFEAWHLGALVGVVATAGILSHRSSPLFRFACRPVCRLGFAAFLAGLEAIWYLTGLTHRGEDWRKNLPFHLCDLGLLAILVSLARAPGFERRAPLVYFLAIPGTALALAVPEVDPPGPYQALSMAKFLVSHGLTLVVGFHLAADERYRPSLCDVARAWGQLVAIGAVMAVVNAWLGWNFMFVSEPTSAVAFFSEIPFVAYLAGYAFVMLVALSLTGLGLRAWNRSP